MPAQHTTRPCEVCQTPFTPKDENHRFCSYACRGRAQRADPSELIRVCEVCGQTFMVKKRSVVQRFCSKRCKGQTMTIKEPTRSLNDQGYVRLHLPDGRRVLEHRYLMEQHLGRPLLPTEYVHHVNEQTDDNRLGNLRVMTPAEHTALHHAPLQWSRHSLCCLGCGTTERVHCARGLCRRCYVHQYKYGDLAPFPHR